MQEFENFNCIHKYDLHHAHFIANSTLRECNRKNFHIIACGYRDYRENPSGERRTRVSRETPKHQRMSRMSLPSANNPRANKASKKARHVRHCEIRRIIRRISLEGRFRSIPDPSWPHLLVVGNDSRLPRDVSLRIY